MPKQEKKQQVTQQPVRRIDTLEPLNLNAAGLDIGSAEIWACVPSDRDEPSVRSDETFTVD